MRRYLQDPAIRAEAQARIAKAITDETRVIVGHSLGSVVACEALCAYPEWPVTALVTLGSPLGIPNLIFDALQPPPKDGRGQWPGSVATWTNIVDRGDIVALEKDLTKLFGDRVVTVAVDNESKAHDVQRYLVAKETGEAIAKALGLPDRSPVGPEPRG